MNNSYSLFVKPSILEGISRILDIAGTLQVYNESHSPAEADARAIRSDFMAISEDIYVAEDFYLEELNQSKN